MRIVAPHLAISISTFPQATSAAGVLATLVRICFKGSEAAAFAFFSASALASVPPLQLHLELQL